MTERLASKKDKKMKVYNEFSGKKLINQEFFADFNWDYTWTPGDIIWIEDYSAPDFAKFMAAKFVAIQMGKVIITAIPNMTARRADKQGIENINDIKWVAIV